LSEIGSAGLEHRKEGRSIERKKKPSKIIVTHKSTTANGTGEGMLITHRKKEPGEKGKPPTKKKGKYSSGKGKGCSAVVKGLGVLVDL